MKKTEPKRANPSLRPALLTFAKRQLPEKGAGVFYKAFFLIIGILVLSPLTHAELSGEAERLISILEQEDTLSARRSGAGFSLSGYTEAGKRSTTQDYEEEDTDNDYTYRNYHLKFAQEISDRLSYNMSSFIYDKNYESNDSLDNISRIFKTNWAYYLTKLKEESLKLDIRLNYKEKRYNNTPTSEYDQISAAPTLTFSRFLRDPATAGKKKNLYTVDLTAGINNYDYLEAGEKNQLKIFSKIGADRYFLEKKLMLTSSYKFETAEHKKVNRKKTKQEVMGGFDYKFELPWIYKITTRANWGQRDTKEEERDEDYDYEYWRYYTKTEHKINPKLKASLKYQYFEKDYITADLDHRGFYIQNGWDYEVLDDQKQRVWLDFAMEHKDANYTIKTDNDYRKEALNIEANYQRKKNWKVSAALEGDSYDFINSSNDKKVYYAKLSAEKLFFLAKAGSRKMREGGDLVLSLDLKHKYTDYEQEDDKEQEAVRIAFNYRF